jgi:DNA-binding IclR family transcriptional regulator
MAGGSRDPGRTATEGVLAVLRAFDGEHPRMPLSEVARRADLPLTTAHRLLGGLVAGELLTRGTDGTYEVGRRLWQIGLLAPVQTRLRDAATPYMQDVYAATHDNVHLAIRDGQAALYVERISGERSVPILSGAGSRLPLHATGVGKVLLAYAPDDVVDAALRSPQRVTRHTIVDERRLRRELQSVRERGFARTAEEMTVGTCSVAVPVFHDDGAVAAALGIVVTSLRRDLMRLVPVLQVAARGISRRLAADPVSP